MLCFDQCVVKIKPNTTLVKIKIRGRVGDPTKTGGLIELALELWNYGTSPVLMSSTCVERDPSLEYSPAGASGPNLSVWSPFVSANTRGGWGY